MAWASRHVRAGGPGSLRVAPGARRGPPGRPVRRPEGGNCVEVAACPNAVHVRGSKAPAGPTLLSPTAWANFLTAERYI
ncbi:DUF397 domain-containing protein [Streptomyces sp. SID1328]|nr:DUF397 domain-containing protein [Streptomyces sp. SID1328]